VDELLALYRPATVRGQSGFAVRNAFVYTL
jgi:hypothetical protein